MAALAGTMVDAVCITSHHHIHHSCHPDHINKNFAFIYPCWDVLFRIYNIPETNQNVRFGISMHYVNAYKSSLGLYFNSLQKRFGSGLQKARPYFKKTVIRFNNQR